jgi:hypothetical protein
LGHPDCDEAQYLSNPDSGRTETVFGEYFDDRNEALPPPHEARQGTHQGELPGDADRHPDDEEAKDMWPIIRDFDPKGSAELRGLRR